MTNAMKKGLTFDDVPKDLPYRDHLEIIIDNAEAMTRRGMLFILHGEHSSGRNPAAFLLAKVFRSHRRRGFCISGERIGEELCRFEGELDQARLRDMRFLVLYDMDPAAISDYEARKVMGTISHTLDNCGSIILTADAMDDRWTEHPLLKRIPDMASRFESNNLGMLIECTGIWEPVGSGADDDIPTSIKQLKWP